MSAVSLQQRTQNFSDALSTDYCPWANRYVYWLKNPCWLLFLAIAGSTVCGIYLNPLVLILTALLMAIAVIGVSLPWIAMRGLECRVSFDVPRTRVGTPAIVRLSVKNSLPFPVWGLSLIKGFARNDNADGNEGAAFDRVPGWSTVEYSWPFEATCRGLYPRSAAEVETSFPFGLFRARKSVESEGRLTVWPLTVCLEGMPDASESRQTEELFSERCVGEFGDIMGTRSFRPGDSLRRVHWAQTARQQTMIVTERQAPVMTSVRVFVDLSETSHPELVRESTVELAIRTAASICESLHRQHSRVELALGGELFVAADGAAGYQRLMDSLAVADVTSEELPHPSRRQGFEILVSTNAGRENGHAHQILVGTSAAGGWLNIVDDEALAGDLPKLWRSACHAS
jgi:uncharacterized protein (DUF58 family)